MCSIQTLVEDAVFCDVMLCRWIGSNIVEECAASIFRIILWPQDRGISFSESWYLSAKLRGVESCKMSWSLV
jgi:hypothetical protein